MTITKNPTVLRRLLAVGAILGLVVAVGCSGDDDDDTATGGDTGTTAASSDDGGAYDDGGAADDGGGDDTGGAAGAVAYQVSSLQYSDVSAPAGGTIDIENSSGAPHTFTADDGAFDVSYGPDETATVEVPTEPGEYAFHCNIHSSMQATLTVS